MTLKMTASVLAIAAVSATAAVARDNVQVAGSSTVLPYASIVAEAFGENFDFPTPVVELGGSSAGLKRFCEGVGENTIDIANASRAIRPAEVETCAANGVTDIIEVRIGYDGIVFASQINGPAFNAFTPSDWFLALAEQLPVDGQMVANPNTNWADVNPDLPAVEIAAFIPGTKHGTREVFEEKVLMQGCEDTGALEAMQAAGMSEDDCRSGVHGGPHRRQVRGHRRRLHRDPGADRQQHQRLGVFGLAFYENNTDTLKVATMGGVEPTTETISTGEYPVSRPLYFYIKKAHIGVIPGLKEFAEFFVADEIAGPDGPLAEYGLVSDPELAQTQQKVADEETMGPKACDRRPQGDGGGMIGPPPHFLLGHFRRPRRDFMPALWLFLLVIALAVAGFFAGAQRALGSAGGDRRLLHSLPSYYGWNIVLKVLTPALGVLVVWLIVQPFWIDSRVATLLPRPRGVRGTTLGLVMSDVRRVAEGLDVAVVQGAMTADEALSHPTPRSPTSASFWPRRASRSAPTSDPRCCLRRSATAR